MTVYIFICIYRCEGLTGGGGDNDNEDDEDDDDDDEDDGGIASAGRPGGTSLRDGGYRETADPRAQPPRHQEEGAGRAPTSPSLLLIRASIYNP